MEPKSREPSTQHRSAWNLAGSLFAYNARSMRLGVCEYATRSMRLNVSNLCYSTVKSASHPENLTANCKVKDAEKALILISGAIEWLDREAMDRMRKYFESTIWGNQVRSGDYPMPRSKHKIVGVVLLSGLLSIPRVEEILQSAAMVEEQSKRKRSKFKMKKYRTLLKPLE